MPASVFAQDPDPRLVAAEGLAAPAAPVWETQVAVGFDPTDLSLDKEAVAVYQLDGVVTPRRIGFAVAKRNAGGQWEWSQEGVIPDSIGLQPPVVVDLRFDPCIAYNPIADDYLAVCGIQLQGSSLAHMAFANFGSPRAPFAQGWRLPAGFPQGVDKMWIVAGAMQAAGEQEFYLTFSVQGNRYCYRSTNGGATWSGQSFGQSLAGVVVAPAACPANGFTSVFVASNAVGTNAYEFFEGTDVTGGAMSWQQLMNPTPPGGPLTLTLNVGSMKSGDQAAYVPVPQPGKLLSLPQIAADPYDPNIFYVVYQDLVVPPSGLADEDANVYLTRLKRVQGNEWQIDPAAARVMVNDPDPTEPPPSTPSDDFWPAVWTTPGPPSAPTQTRVHVIFYSDRKYPNQIDTTHPLAPSPVLNYDAKLDVYYAWSEDRRSTFTPPPLTDVELFQVPPEAGVDFGLVFPNQFMTLDDYIGIGHRPRPNGGFEIWTTWPGTHFIPPVDPPENLSVIYGVRIPWAQP